MSRLGKLTFAQKKCLGPAGLLMQRTGMIWPGARVGVAVSGGVDSWVLLQVLLLRQRIVPFPFEVMAIHLNPGFDATSHAPLAPWTAAHGVALHAETTDYGPMAHGPENRKNSPCFLCAWHRRKRLFELCKHYGLTHLALGHNADDLVQTFFMNLFRNGRVEGLSPKEEYFGGELILIRPLLLLEKPMIRRAAAQWKLHVWSNSCPSATNSERSRTEAWLRTVLSQDSAMHGSVYGALKRWQLDVLHRSQLGEHLQ
ncbi:ATP-binding protein [Desulfonatronum sp. SC1]|uniref:tRNA lysidine(34) synthetase n=1 Tax=Desulfonatronum sp. SC1 TaxID=2109626 RepID=UPI000D31678A|nr:ATP-binding protein [Desulfonatronum sp. SC1]PTN39120.1 tRNA 2-thiocytidine biosynthesis protein TtcA [Desulfonatronum sp. SC1]